MATTFKPPYSPFLTRSTNLNSWIPRIDGPAGGGYPIEWRNPSTYLGIGGLIRIDNTTTTWLGRDDEVNAEGLALDYVDQTVTPTTTVQTFQNAKLELTVSYFSPIEPNDLVRQSFPFSYISVQAQSRDQQSHTVQVYLVTRAHWLHQSYIPSDNLTLSTHETGSMMYFQANRTRVKGNSAPENQPEDVTLYFGMPLGEGTSYDLSQGLSSSDRFKDQGFLSNNSLPDGNYQWGSDTTQVRFALSKDISVTPTGASSPALFALGLVRDPSILYTPTPSGTPETRSPCFKTAFDNAGDALADFFDDYSNATRRGAELDERITRMANDVSPESSDLVALTARSDMAAMDVTCGSESEDIMIFASSMNSKHENPDSRSYSNRVDDLYAAWPAVMTINATYGRYILEPLMRFQNAGTGTPYAIPDLGYGYPRVTGGNPTETIAQRLGIEETGNMLLMIWAQVRFTGDMTLVKKYYSLLQRWAGYLQTAVPRPDWGGQASNADSEASQNTNLALKSILGIQAMAEIAWANGDHNGADQYNMHATNLYHQWITDSFSEDHLKLQFNANASWGLMYNMYPDKWLGLDVIDQEVYTAQDKWYQPRFGSPPPYDSSGQKIKTHWASFTAAAMSENSTRAQLIDAIHGYAELDDATLFPSEYSQNGSEGEPATSRGQGSIVLGSMFASPALGLDIKQSTHYVRGSDSRPPDESQPSDVSTSAIVGAVVGGFAAVALLLALCLFCRRKRARDNLHGTDVDGVNTLVSPFVSISGERIQVDAKRGTGLRVDAGEHERGPVISPEDPARHPPASAGGRIADQIFQIRRDVLEVLRQDPPPQYHSEVQYA